MSFILNRDINNKIVKKTVIISTVPTINNSISIGTTGTTNIANVAALNFNGTNITASASQLNYLNVVPGVAEASKALVVNADKNITGINALSSTNLLVNGVNITPSMFSSTSSDDLNSPYLTSVTPGNAGPLKALVASPSLSISQINNMASKTITLNNVSLSLPPSTKNLNLTTINNKRLNSASSLTTSIQNMSWNQFNTNNSSIDSIYWQSICWSHELSLFVAVGSGSYSSYPTSNNRVMTSPNGINWTIRSSAADISWQSVCWSSSLGLFIAVANNGNATNGVMSSSDGVVWTSRATPVGNSWQSVCWSPELSLFVAVAISGYGNRAINSTDGINWNICGTTPDNSWQFICWSPELNLFAAVASNGTNRIMTSANGVNWSSIPEPTGTSGSWSCICWSAELGIFLAVANSGTNNRNFLRSSDGINWISSNEQSGLTLSTVAWSKDLEIFLGVESGGQNWAYSYNGIVWYKIQISSSSYPPAPGMIIWSSVFKMFIVVSNSNGVIGSSTGNRVWHTYNTTIGPKGGVMCNQSNIFINHSNNYVGINTTNPERPLEINSISGNCFKHMYLQDNTKSYSYDVLNTGQFNINTTKYFNITSDYLTYGLLLNNTIVKSTVTEFNDYLTGITDGVAQASKTAILNSNLDISGINLLNCNLLTVNGITIDYSSNNQYFQGVGSGVASASKALSLNNSSSISEINNIKTSKLLLNGSYINSSGSKTINANTIINKTKYPKADITKAMNTWTLRSTSDNNYYSNAYSPELGIFVGVSTSGTNKVATSTNGVVWTDVVSSIASAGTWYSVCWSPELALFVAVGSTPYAMTSTNGVVWVSRVIPENNTWRSICWSPELLTFVAVAMSGSYRAMTSHNGIDWYKGVATAAIFWTNVCWSGSLGLFVAAATDNTNNSIMTSTDGTSWVSRNTPFSSPIQGLTYSSDLEMFIAASGTSTYFYSYDGIEWLPNTFSTSGSWNYINWISDIGIFVAMTVSTVGITYSYDGFVWIPATVSGNSNYYSSLSWSSELSMLVAISFNGTAGFKVFTSDIFSPNSKSCILSNTNDFNVNNLNGRVGLGAPSTSFQLQLSTDSASKPSTSTWTVSSDSRLKEDIQDADLDLCYNNLKNLRLARYTWKNDIYSEKQVPDRSKLGWIAQEVETIFPKSVKKINAHGFSDCRTLNTDQIIASLYGFTQKLIKNYDNDDILFTSITNRANNIQTFIDNIPEE